MIKVSRDPKDTFFPGIKPPKKLTLLPKKIFSGLGPDLRKRSINSKVNYFFPLSRLMKLKVNV